MAVNHDYVNPDNPLESIGYVLGYIATDIERIANALEVIAAAMPDVPEAEMHR